MRSPQPYLEISSDFFTDRTLIKIVRDIFLDKQGREVNPNTLRYIDGTLYTKDLICKGRLVRKKMYFDLEKGLFSLKVSGIFLDGNFLMHRGTKEIIRLLGEYHEALEDNFTIVFPWKLR